MSRYTDVPSKIDFPALERKILAWWAEHRSFEKLREQNKGKQAWSFLDGPITANNPMGVHHAWGRSYKDVFCRYNAMLGRELRYQNGFDCQGLWVEVEVEKELGFKSKRDIEEYGIDKFVEKCKERVKKFAAIQTQQSQRLGYWMDWDNSYFTMSDENNYTIWAFLKKCHENGWVFKGTDVMPWCGRCGTGLSQHEIATEGYRQLTHVSPFLRFPLKGRENEALLVWTTTPWTLTSNVAAAVHPEKTYLKVKQGDQIYYLIEAREAILKDKGPHEVLEKLPGSALVGLEYHGPFDELKPQTGLTHRVIPWTEVGETEGTGIVHIAPGCGKEDFALHKEHKLEVIAPLDELGNFKEGFEPWTGRNASTVWEDILASLREKKLLYKQEKYTHAYPVCWRCQSELLFRLVDEWYISMGEQDIENPTPEQKKNALRYQMMDVIKEARWIPSWGYDRELDWLKNMHDWMISKKRYWGLALPIFECPDCQTFEVVGGRDELKERAVEGWAEFEGHSPHRPHVDGVRIACPKCSKPISRVKDVGNPWLDAGIVAFSTLNWSTDKAYWERWFPAELITESFPGQFRNWFYSLLAMSTVMAGRSPFKTLFGYASMRAADGREMHKSWGNSIEFNEAADKAGVDAMRWLYASHNPEQNLLFGYDAIGEARRKFLTLWNVYSFFITYAQVENFDPRKDKVPVAERNVLDRWILGALQVLIQDAHHGYANYQLHVFMRNVERFVDDLSNWYVRRSRRRFWKSEDDRDKLAALQTLHEVLVALCEIMAPVIPFVTEEMYQNLVRTHDPAAKESVHHRTFPQADSALIDAGLNKTMERILAIVELGRQARQKAALKVRQPLGRVLIKVPADEVDAVRAFESQITEELNVKAVEYRQDLSDLLRSGAKLDAKKAGPRLGKSMQKVLAAFKALPPDTIAAALAKGPLDLTVEGVAYQVLPEEVVVERAAQAGWTLGEFGEVAVLISTEVTEELKAEGLVRDLIRFVQDARKNAGLDVSDRIELSLKCSNELHGAAEAFLDMLKRETLAVAVEFGPPSGTVSEVDLEGEKLELGINKKS